MSRPYKKLPDSVIVESKYGNMEVIAVGQNQITVRANNLDYRGRLFDVNVRLFRSEDGKFFNPALRYGPHSPVLEYDVFFAYGHGHGFRDNAPPQTSKNLLEEAIRVGNDWVCNNEETLLEAEKVQDNNSAMSIEDKIEKLEKELQTAKDELIALDTKEYKEYKFD